MKKNLKRRKEIISAPVKGFSKMEDFKKVLAEDLTQFNRYLKEKNLELCNIITNRINTNAVLLDSKEYVLLSVVLKDLIGLIGLAVSPEIQLTIIEDFNKNTKNINLEVTRDQILELYQRNYENIAQNLDFQEKYTKDPEFTKFTSMKLVGFLLGELENKRLSYRITQMFWGVLNEFNRVFKTHGFDQRSLILKLTLEYFSRIYEYFRFAILNVEENQKKEWENLFEPYLIAFKKNLESYSKEEDNYLNSSIDLIFDFSKEWRQMFIRFLEIGQRILKERRKDVEIPKNLKNKMKQIIEKGVKAEMEEE